MPFGRRLAGQHTL